MIYVKVTDLTDYSFCPRKVYLKRVLGLREETNYQMLLGKIIHEIFENLNESEDKIVYEIDDNYDFQYILNLYKDYVSNLFEQLVNKYEEEIKELKIDLNNLKLDVFSNIMFDIEDRAKLVYQYMMTENVYGIELWELLEPKIITELDVRSEAYKLVGRIDRIEKYRNMMIPYEIKSGRFMKDHLIQIHAYYLLLKKEFPNYDIPHGIILYLRNKRKKEVYFSKNMLIRVLDIKDKVEEIIENQKDPGVIKKVDKCSKCAFYRYCYKNDRT